MNKRDRFEQIYAENNQLDVEAVQAMRVRDTYDTLKVASSYRYFCEGWEAFQTEQLAVALDTVRYGTGVALISSSGFEGAADLRKFCRTPDEIAAASDDAWNNRFPPEQEKK